MTDADRLREQVDRQLEEVREQADDLFRRTSTEVMHRAVFHAGGKLRRPRVVFVCAAHGAALGGAPDWSLVGRAALAIELAHVGSLYHDDMVDRSPTRRGVPTVHRRLGVRAGALGGAHLFVLANALFASLPDPLPRRWGAAALRFGDGQLRDTERARTLDFEVEDYLRIARRKTGTAFELATCFGGALGGAPAPEREALVSFGRRLGIAYQLFNDLDDFVTPAAQHRPPANDLRERVYTLPVLFGCARQDGVGGRLRELLRNDGRPLGENAATEVQEILLESGAFAEAIQCAIEHREAARTWLEHLARTPARELLEGLVASLEPPSRLVREDVAEVRA